MTDTQLLSLLPATEQPTQAAVRPQARGDAGRTIFRDTTLAAETPFSGPGLYATDDSDQITPMIHLGLAALLLPTFAYAASVLVSLTANGALEKAVRTLLP